MLAAFFVASSFTRPCEGQTSLALTTQPAVEASDSDLVSIEFAGTIDLRTLAAFVGNSLSRPVLLADDVADQKLAVSGPVRVPRSHLLNLLRSAAQTRGATVTEDLAGGMIRVGSNANLAASAAARQGDATDAPQIRTFELTTADPAELEPFVRLMLTAPGGSCVVLQRQRTLVVADYGHVVDRVADLVARLDRPSASTRILRFEHASPARAEKLLRDLMGDADGVRIASDEASGLLIVSGPAAALASAEALHRSLDVADRPSDGAVRLYKLDNTTAADVLRTLRSIRSPNADAFTSANDRRRTISSTQPYNGAALPTDRTALRGDSPDVATLAFSDAGVRVTADAGTNTILVAGPASAQAEYEKLIRQLDRRRPQVMLECIVAVLDTSDGFSLGVEIGARGGAGRTDVITFSSFGLSKVDATTGRLALIPGIGFNGALLNADVADVVVQALATSRRAKVVSAPRVLVNDNSTGHLASIAEEPFSSVNAANTVSTTSFAGYAQAGTEVRLTPHISDAGYLQLDYAVALNSFTGTGKDGIPPPRQTDAIESSVTIPDGTTIVVGGLNRQQESSEVRGVPLLMDIPGVGELFKSRGTSRQQKTLFVFIRPVVLRDDEFADLQALTGIDLARARRGGVDAADVAPSSLPRVMR